MKVREQWRCSLWEMKDKLAFCEMVFFFYFLCHIICIFFAVAMTDKDGMAGVMIAADFLIHKLYQLLKGFFTAADFTDVSEFSVVVYMKDRFNIQHASYYCSSSGNAASAV